MRDPPPLMITRIIFPFPVSEGLIMELDSIKQFDAQYETDMHTISCYTG